MIILGSLDVFNTGDGIRITVNTEPYLDTRYEDLEGNGETLKDALADLLEQVERLPE